MTVHLKPPRARDHARMTSAADIEFASQPAAHGFPPPPRSWEDLGVPFNVVTDIVLKLLYTSGTLVGRDIASRACLPWFFVREALKHLSDQCCVQSTGFPHGGGREELLPGEDIGASMVYMIVADGRDRARDLCEINQYAGPVPLPIETYVEIAKEQARGNHDVSLEDLRQALSHLTLADETLFTLGPAVSERHTLFMYGAPGNGKTSVAEALCRLMGPPLYVPHALYVHGQIIRFFDPIHHVAVGCSLPDHDKRWVLVERPAVVVGGELTPEMLDLSFDNTLGYFQASVQMKANGGLFLVDDFGRQAALSPSNFLNRLIIPLERGYDHLTLPRAATSITMPFTTMLVLSSNLEPLQLVDEAFLRRLHFKVVIMDPTEEQFRAIWKAECAATGVAYDDQAIDYVIHQWYRRLDPPRPFRGVHARDLIKHVRHAARFRGRPALLDRELLDAACAAYFLMA